MEAAKQLAQINSPKLPPPGTLGLSLAKQLYPRGRFEPMMMGLCQTLRLSPADSPFVFLCPLISFGCVRCPCRLREGRAAEASFYFRAAHNQSTLKTETRQIGKWLKKVT